MDAVVFPDVEALAIRALTDPLGVLVTTEVPDPRPASFVQVTRVGGPRRDRVTDAALVTFKAWADDETVAEALAARTRAYVFALAQTSVDEDFVRSVVEIGGLQSFPDPLTKTPRYQFTAQLNTKGTPL